MAWIVPLIVQPIIRRTYQNPDGTPKYVGKPPKKRRPWQRRKR